MRQNFRLINEISYRVKTDTTLISDINLELLHKTLESDVIFYLPDPNVFLEFIKNYCSIISGKYKKINKIFFIVEDNTTKKIEAYKRILPNNVTMITEKDLPEPIANAVIIFDDLKNIGNFNDLVRNNYHKISNFACSFGFTTSPFFFYDLYTSTDLRYAAYTPTIFVQNTRWFYKKAFENSEIRYYKKIEEEVYTSKSKTEINQNLRNLFQLISTIKINGNSEQKDIAKRLVFLLCNGLYKTNFVVEVLLKDKRFTMLKDKIIPYQFTSDKLAILINEIMNTPYNDVVIVFDIIEIMDIVYSIVKYELSFLKLQQDMQTNETKYTITIKLNGDVQKHLRFVSFKDLELHKEDRLLIYYDFKPIYSKSKKVILYPASKKDIFANLISFERKIETEIRKNLKLPELLNTNKKKDSSKNFAIKIYTDKHIDRESLDPKDVFQINEFDQDKNIIYIEKLHNFSFVGFKIVEQVNEPVEFDFIKPNHDNISIVALGVEFGTIADRKIFTNSHSILCPTYVFFRRDVISIYCFGKEHNYKIKIASSCFEDYVFIEKNDFILNFYLCLDRKPKVFISQNISSITRKWSSISTMKSTERYNLLESVVWNRCSIDEVPFMNHRNDIKISFDLKNNGDYSKIKEVIINNRKKLCDSKSGRSKSKEEVENLKIKLFDIIDCLISFFRRYQSIQLIFSNLQFNRDNFLGTKEIYEHFNKLDFDDFFYIMCLISQKERYLSYNLTKVNCEEMKIFNIFNLVNYLLSAVNRRFLDISQIISHFKDLGVENNERKMRQVIVTPLEIIYKMPVVFESNRILREFDFEKFLRVSLREEDLKTKIKDTVIKDQNFIYDYYRNILNEGMFLGPRKYFFVAMTTSQMKLHNAWFLTPYFSKNILIGPDYIRNWLGDFSEIKNIGKYAMRLGQALSSTIPTVDINHFIEIRDNIKNRFNFTDGVGVISLSYAKILSDKLGLEEIPSAFQIRFGGYKGLIVAHPINIEDINYLKEFDIDEKLGQGVLSLLRSDRNKNAKRFKLETDDFVCIGEQNIMFEALSSQGDNDTVLVLRKSMRKFNSQHRNMECITHSSTNPCYLNRQIINLLEGLGIDVSIFLEHQDNYILSLLSEMYTNPVKYIRKVFGGIPPHGNVKDLKIFKKLLLQISNKTIKDLYKKNKILIEKGAVLMGTVDELMVLKENEVFIKVKKNLVGKYDNFIIDGDYCIIIGPCIIVKNPCLHPGDVRRVIGVNKPELGFMRNVLVFNQAGERPIPNMCSGSDLDGDMYTVIWEKTLLPTVYHEPSIYEDQTFLSKEVVCLKDIVNFYIRYIRNFHLGSIAHAHMVYCDLTDVKSENSKLLAELFNKSIDFPRTGFVASVPESLIPISYPDFIQIRGNVYPSFKTLGVLFRRSVSLLMNTNVKCECQDCLKRFIDGLHVLLKMIFQGSQVKYKKLSIKNMSEMTKTANNFYDGFKRDLNILINKFGFNKEDDILLQFKSEQDESYLENVMVESKRFYKKIKNDIRSKKINQSNLLKRSEECTENMNSLPLAFVDHEGYSFSYINLYRNEDNNGFIYNSKIYVNQVNIKDGKEEIINSKEDDIFFYEKENMIDGQNQRKDFVESKDLIKNDKIHVFTDTKIYKKFTENINRSFDESFSEIFNLLFLTDFFDSRSFDLAMVFFLFLQSKIKSNDKLEISKALFRLSREFYKNPTDETLSYFIYKAITKPKGNFYLIKIKNKVDIKRSYIDNSEEVKLIIDKIARTISTVGYLLIFNINLVQKYISMKNTIGDNYQKTQTVQNYIKKGGQGELVIKGMFDTSDELKLELYQGIKHILHKDVNVFSPKLMNQGFCEIETHKINVKEFFINSYFNFLLPRIQKNIRQMSENKFINYLVTVTILPGKFYIYDVPNNFINEIMTIETLSSSLQFYKKNFNEDNKTFLKSYFFNNNDLIDEDTRNDFIKKKNINFKEKVFLYTFTVVHNNIRYQIYYDLVDGKFIPNLITKGRSVAGKVFVLNDADKMDKDAAFEIMYEEIIFKGDFRNMTSDESRIFSEELLTMRDNTFIVSKSLKNCKNFRFEIDVKICDKGSSNIELLNRQIFTGGRDIFTLELKHKRLVVNSITTNTTSTNEGKGLWNITEFINIFEKSWECYVKYYA